MCSLRSISVIVFYIPFQFFSSSPFFSFGNFLSSVLRQELLLFSFFFSFLHSLSIFLFFFSFLLVLRHLFYVKNFVFFSLSFIHHIFGLHFPPPFTQKIPTFSCPYRYFFSPFISYSLFFSFRSLIFSLSPFLPLLNSSPSLSPHFSLVSSVLSPFISLFSILSFPFPLILMLHPLFLSLLIFQFLRSSPYLSPHFPLITYFFYSPFLNSSLFSLSSFFPHHFFSFSPRIPFF